MNKQALRDAFHVAIPVILGYLSIGLVFGLLLTGNGYAWWLSLVMSLLIYAGTAQYMAVDFFLQNTPLWQVAFMTFLLNSRHMFYGLSLLEPFARAGKYRPYLIFSLTDETYALLTSVSPPSGTGRAEFSFCLSAINHAAWLAGSLLGALAGTLIPFDLAGIDFALTALFIVLLLEQARSCSAKYPFLAGLAAAGASLAVFGPDNMLLPAVVLAAVFLVLARRKVEPHDT
ncbi:MAG: AzlC family ABC transporter permease [Gracilibacteraceae bacterium]|jgi:4-azaleucine resistance transporter AzlC|nr:AzlC family ABC transporter permease [Gracilibacteraceae bacterium]